MYVDLQKMHYWLGGNQQPQQKQWQLKNSVRIGITVNITWMDTIHLLCQYHGDRNRSPPAAASPSLGPAHWNTLFFVCFFNKSFFFANYPMASFFSRHLPLLSFSTIIIRSLATLSCWACWNPTHFFNCWHLVTLILESLFNFLLAPQCIMIESSSSNYGFNHPLPWLVIHQYNTIFKARSHHLSVLLASNHSSKREAGFTSSRPSLSSTKINAETILSHHPSYPSSELRMVQNITSNPSHLPSMVNTWSAGSSQYFKFKAK